jgi:hypothetical protein
VLQSSPIAESENLGQLLNFYRDDALKNQRVISYIRADGNEILDPETDQLRDIQISHFHSIEILYAHPRELAEDTLQLMKKFCTELSQLSQETAQQLEIQDPLAISTFRKLLEGIETFSDSITQTRRTLRIGVLPQMNLLEADLVSLLKDLAVANTTNDEKYRLELLSIHLPKNLEEWRDSGIPAMIRSRDS